MTFDDSIVISGARVNNLRDVSLRIPKNKIVVFTGVSGSGKSSLVFDTVAVESQRQLNETFSWFLRNRMPKYERPDADLIDRLSPAIVVDQRPVGGNARSTVGTMTDIYSVIRVLFSRHGVPSAGEATAYSFNDPHGMCPECDGLGRVVRLDLERFLQTDKSLNEGPFRFGPLAVGTWQWGLYARTGLFDPDKQLRDFTPEEWDLLLYGAPRRVVRPSGSGSNTYEGVVRRIERLYLKRNQASVSNADAKAVQEVVTEAVCPSCEGARLNQAALASRVNGRGIAELCRMEISDLIETLGEITDPAAAPIARAAVTRLRRVTEIGLGYLSLDRETATLSGGEAQRLKVVRHLGSSLTGMTYIFDEPSVGMHPRDVDRLTALLAELRDKGNTVLVVEHDPDVIRAADHVIDMGPGAGAHGGEVVFTGTVEELRQADTLTGRHLNRPYGTKPTLREPTGWLTVSGSAHNLKDVSVLFPTGVLTVVTGVAGAGKSTLVMRELATQHPEAIVVTQAPIVASRRSSPATFLGVMDPIRRLFAKANGVDPGLFSFNSSGACPTCKGNGVIYTDLAFMDPVTTTCQTCKGRRYREEVLYHRLRGRTIVDVLDLTAEEAQQFFTERPIAARLRALSEVGLTYLTLGQPLSSLSGGERQRLKLAGQLRHSGQVYVLDEPTTGLHMADIGTLLALLDRLVDQGNTVVVVEHNLDVIHHADWLITLGPEAGKHGGRITFTGPPPPA